VDVVVDVRLLASREGEVGSNLSTSSSPSFRGVSFSPASSLRWTTHTSSSVHSPVTSMAKLKLATDRYIIVVVMSEHQLIVAQERKMDACTLSFHRRLRIEGAEIGLNCSQRYIWVVGRERFGKGMFCFLPSKSPVYPKSLVYISAIYYGMRY
jgi:ATP-binding cassette subfamily F protein 2